MQPGSPRVCPALACAVGAWLAVGCAERPKGVDLLRAAPVRLAEASAAGEDAHAVRARRRQAPAHPRRRARLAPRLAPEPLPLRHRRPRARASSSSTPGSPAATTARAPSSSSSTSATAGGETTVVSKLVDPANRPAAPRVGDARGRPLGATRGRERRDRPRDPRLRGDGDAGPRVLGHARRSRWPRDARRAARDRLPRRHAARRPPAALRLLSRHRARALALRARTRSCSTRRSPPSSWTKPSVASLFTSLLPRDHGCVQFYTPLDPALVTLAERMRDRGYATGAVVANPLVLAKNMHFDQGFSYFAVPAATRRAGPGGGRRARLPRRAPRASPPSSTCTRWTRTRPTSRRRRSTAVRAAPRAGPGRRRALRLPGARRPRPDRRPVRRGDRVRRPRVRAPPRRASASAASTTARTIVFLSDHGEEFLDHGGWVHGHTLFDELVRVPLVVKYPGRREAGRRVARPGPAPRRPAHDPEEPGPARARRGRRARPRRRASTRRAPGARRRCSRRSTASTSRTGARYGRAKYVRHLHPRAQRDGFFDLRRDPRERRPREPGVEHPCAGAEATPPRRRCPPRPTATGCASTGARATSCACGRPAGSRSSSGWASARRSARR